MTFQLEMASYVRVPPNLPRGTLRFTISIVCHL